MELWTIQLAQWRAAKARGVPLIDTTVKSGDPVFAPNWTIVQGVKANMITEQEYTERYLDLMRSSFKQNRPRWLTLCSMEQVAIACYCPVGVFCHRHLLANMIEKVCSAHGLPFQAMGELLPSPK